MKDILKSYVDGLKIAFAAIRTDFIEKKSEELTLPEEWQLADVAEEGKILMRKVATWGENAVVSNIWEKGSVIFPHKHPDMHEYVTVHEGRLKEQVTGDIIEPNTTYFIKANKPHHFKALERTLFTVKFEKIASKEDRYKY